MVHKISLACALVCFVLALSVGEAQGQVPAPSSYLFVDVKDTAGQPVTDANIAVYGADGEQITHGVSNEAKIRVSFPIRTDHHYSVLVSKQGFQPSEHVFFAKPSNRGRTLVQNMQLGYIREESSAIVLRKPPATAAERSAFYEQELQAQIILAAKRGDPLRVSKLLQLGIDADTVDIDGVSALVWAAFAGDADTINALLEGGAHVRTKNPLGSKALLIYLAEGLVREQQRRTPRADNLGDQYKRGPTVSNLIKAGADVNAKDPYLGTTLNAALRAVSPLPVAAIDSLLKAGANVNTPDEGRLTTPLMWASQSGSLESVKMLLAAGALIDVKDKQGRTALMWAQVVRGEPGNYDPEVVNTLIKSGANVNVSDENEITPLILAAQLDRTESVKMLLAAGAKVNAKDKLGNTALIAAFDSYYISQNDKDPIHHPSPLTIRTLLTAGADINAVARDKPPLIMLAARTDSLEALKMLLEAGADINVRNQKRQTALMYDKLWGYAPGVEAFKILIAAGADLNAVGPGGRTPLMSAAYGAPPEIVDLLLERGAKASINARDDSGQTALMHAAYYYSGFNSTAEDRLRTIKALLDAGADVTIKDSSGQTALSIAETYNNRNQAVIELLKSRQPH